MAVQISDRECLVNQDGFAQRLRHAEHMVKHGQGEGILFTDGGVPVCARRFVALASKGGDDDMFSADFTDQEFQVTKTFCACTLHASVTAQSFRVVVAVHKLMLTVLHHVVKCTTAHVAQFYCSLFWHQAFIKLCMKLALSG